MAPYQIGFQEANFPQRLAWCQSALEGLSQRWIPCGMPRLNQRFSQAVFFLYGMNPRSGKLEGPCGTGVIIGIHEFPKPISLYAVTAAHVVSSGASVIRLNAKGGKHVFIELDAADWHSMMPRDDIAAVDITGRVPTEADSSYFPTDLLIGRGFIKTAELGLGEDGFMLGLFAGHPGSSQNMVAARFGNVSQLANEDEPITYGDGDTVTSPCHVFDIHSRPGFSGSPVFIYRTPDGDLRNLQRRTHNFEVKVRSERHAWLPSEPDPIRIVDRTPFSSKFLGLFGIHVSQFHDAVRVRKAQARPRSEDSTVRHGDQIRFPGSMTIVVPSWRILELLEEPQLKEVRDKREANHAAAREAKLSVPEPESSKPTSEQESDNPESDANPDHLEDFTRLLGAAVRGKPSEGQT